MRMFIASAEIEIFLYEPRSLKEKRQIIKSLMARISNQFNVSIAEVDLLDVWQRAVIGIACVTNTVAHAQKQLDGILDYMEEDGRFEIVSIYREVF